MIGQKTMDRTSESDVFYAPRARRLDDAVKVPFGEDGWCRQKPGQQWSLCSRLRVRVGKFVAARVHSSSIVSLPGL